MGHTAKFHSPVVCNARWKMWFLAVLGRSAHKLWASDLGGLGCGNKEGLYIVYILYQALGGQTGEIKQRKSIIVLEVIFTEVAALEIRHCVHHSSKYHVLHFHLKTAVLRLPSPPMWPAMWCYRAAFYRRVWEHLGLALLVVLVFPLEAAFERGKKQLRCVFTQNWRMRPA